MKKSISKIIILSLIMMPFMIPSLAGCNNHEAANDSAKAENTSSVDNTEDLKTTNVAQETDIDLTIMSSTMVYAEIYNITTNPDDYLGKSIRLSGSYYTAHYDKTDKWYHFVLIEDASACCQQGLEFTLNDDYRYPDDYPDDMTNIEIEGTYESYEELGQTYYYVANAVLLSSH